MIVKIIINKKVLSPSSDLATANVASQTLVDRIMHLLLIVPFVKLWQLVFHYKSTGMWPYAP